MAKSTRRFALEMNAEGIYSYYVSKKHRTQGTLNIGCT